MTSDIHSRAREGQRSGISGGGSDGAIVEGMGRGDLDGQSVGRYLGRVAAAGRRAIPAGQDPWESLRQAGLVRGEDQITRAACLLFAKEPQRFLPAATIECVAYGYDAASIAERQSVGGSVLDHAAKAQAFLERNMRGAVVRENGRAELRWEYPPELVREILAYAVCHRDYGENRAIQVGLFDAFLHVGVPGGLLPGQKAEDLAEGRGGGARPRNPLLAEAFRDMGMAEGSGNGLAQALAAARANGNPPPQWAAGRDFAAKFFPRPDAEKSVRGLLPELPASGRPALAGKMALRVYDMILAHPGINAPRLSDLLDISIGSVSVACRALKEHRLVEHRGARTGGGYYAR